ncbi:MAG: hypothetical protein A2931_03125 [Candidatus Niyogibacteria bacterium RIFCSPLOWO2_01_FULL_45_48]|uniref:DUF5667 domain-containing protein n=2 Tax=Candidatus Niyogiibacteriota TaxID=1817912 RepID=A0A1G2EXH4_9BACT|nr:MAG: hypothetical protein A2835_03385 [Candidatus Niyogibacteria bacterium RIFCSPHIGHO2_01_FULL_45_28]OGZ30427.1 MAG: hypothetical protein A3J00_04110 [Candidatus Niyogibacteria bacterium RIFCSPLOWO2_02_FULL_45_13]OGZ31336.1 MAG: hypothetical protein A2931_03125 [Candidatus Niyogibacteria bacterium RIFCSPLOWO2_01_FULL_45_48]
MAKILAVLVVSVAISLALTAVYANGETPELKALEIRIVGLSKQVYDNLDNLASLLSKKGALIIFEVKREIMTAEEMFLNYLYDESVPLSDRKHDAEGFITGLTNTRDHTKKKIDEVLERKNKKNDI